MCFIINLVIFVLDLVTVFNRLFGLIECDFRVGLVCFVSLCCCCLHLIGAWVFICLACWECLVESSNLWVYGVG